MDDLRKFNITGPDGRFLCPVCGLPGYFTGESYDASGGMIGTGICPCCLWEPGFDDDVFAGNTASPTVLQSIHIYREKWISAGFQWRGHQNLIPEEWSARDQLSLLYKAAPFIE